MSRALLLIPAIALAACAREPDPPPRPDAAASERLASIEARLDAAEAADPAPPREAQEKGPDTAVPDPLSSD
ncbi:hypothetical protein [Sphingomicrobium astaxanthinifaciens]|uniref:hypothetical protein n=1 Tax=Sphingomicrobium astaxanthinifaciens TaxID=1227949 RepID=UPI001FCB0EBC|nr:hypothetical protein [Sphingomicrobium astaxanthinifaciens]MCJ7421683.1 hypothetical protein [Sphingomicrobium astaxanthinifaciens]